jgi:dolichyl-phosphate-mannose-protein mannosyltransferase
MEEHRRWPRMLVPALLVGTAALLMIWGVGHPNRIVFDEVYYANDGRDFLEFGVEQGFVVHPPLGKLAIAASILVFGDNPVGWRAFGGIAATITVLLVYLIGLRLFRRQAPAALAAFLLAVDGAFIVQARTSMLDIYLALFVVLGAWLLVVDRQQVNELDAELVAADPGTKLDRLPHRDRRFLYLAGIAFGLGMAVKWSGALALGAAGLATIGWELARRKRLTGRWFRQAWRGVGLIAAALVLIPVASYAVTWTPWFLNFENSYEGRKVCDDPDDCNVTFPSRVAALGRFHKAVAKFHQNLDAEHSYRAPAYTWPILARPVVFYYETCSENRFNRAPKTDDDGKVEIPEPCAVERGQAAEMLGVGNLVLWWSWLPASAVLMVGAVRRDRRTGIPLLFAAAQFLPWLIVSRPVFSFYTVPLVPFVALGVGAAAARVADRARVGVPVAIGAAGAAFGALLAWIYDLTGGSPTRAVYGLTAAFVGLVAAGVYGIWGPKDPPPLPAPAPATRWVIGSVTLLAALLAAFFLPIWTGIPMSEGAVKLRWWFRGWI